MANNDGCFILLGMSCLNNKDRNVSPAKLYANYLTESRDPHKQRLLFKLLPEQCTAVPAQVAILTLIPCHPLPPLPMRSHPESSGLCWRVQ